MALKFPNTSNPFGDASKPMKQPLKMVTLSTDSDANDATTVTPTPSSTDVVKRWVCDVCKVRKFADFEQACAHEKRCKERKERQQQQEKEQEQPEMPQRPQASQQEKQKEVIEPKVEHKQRTKAPLKDPPVKPERQKQPAEKQLTTKQKDPKVASKPRQSTQKAPKSEPKCEEKKETNKPKPKPTVAASATHSFFAPRKPGAANSKKRPSPDKQASGTVTSFFQPRTTKKQKGSTITPSQSQQSTAAILSQSSTIEILDDSQPDPMVSDEVQVIGTKQLKPKQRKLTHKQDDVTVDNAHHVANALAAMITRQTSLPPSSSQSSSSSSSKNAPLAGIFQLPTKELIAEHRHAEFQAKRRLERQQELERQQKRRARAMTEPPARKSKPATSTFETVLKLPLAPRFPVPSHVMKTPDVLDPVAIRVPDGWKRAMETDSSSSATDVSKKLVSSPAALDCLPNPSEQNAIQQAFHQVLQPPSSSSMDPKPLPLVDQYPGLVGKEAENVQRDLVKWVRDWCKVREEAWKRMMERQRKLAKRPKARIQKKKKKKSRDDYDSDDLWDDDDFDGGELRNLVLLTGDSGSGKTAMVHQVAAQAKCPLLEINTTQARGGAALKHAIQEATQSCSSLDMIQRQSRKLNQSPFGEDSDDDDDEKDGAQKVSALTVILIDEVDFLYEEQGDAGFWSALASVTKTAKCPIFVTANSKPPQMDQFPHFHLWPLDKPSPVECMTKLLQVCRQEGIPMRPELDQKEIKSRLCHVAEICGCDIRRMLNELQSFLHPVPEKLVPIERGPSPTTVSNLEWSASMELPRLDSLNPSKVSTTKHSIVAIHGKNFNSLRCFKGEWNVLLGDKRCKSHLVDDEHLLILCPPQSEEAQGFQSISIQLSNGGKIGCTSVEILDLPGGSKITGRKCVWLQYESDPELPNEEDNNEDEEIEFEGSAETKPKQDLKTSTTTKDVEADEAVLESWKSLTAEQDGDKIAPADEPKSKSQDDHLLALEMLAENAYDLSDAIFLEDFQDGVPFLSGACLGYGFDLTEGAECEKGKMKMSEQLRP